ncbi:MAG: hypothetical protein ACLP4V_21010 [Methylocella sp.]
MQRQVIGGFEIVIIDAGAELCGDLGSGLIDLLRHVILMSVVAPDGRARSFHGSDGIVDHPKKEVYAWRRRLTDSEARVGLLVLQQMCVHRTYAR